MKKPNPIARALRAPHLRAQKIKARKGKGAYSRKHKDTKP